MIKLVILLVGFLSGVATVVQIAIWVIPLLNLKNIPPGFRKSPWKFIATYIPIVGRHISLPTAIVNRVLEVQTVRDAVSSRRLVALYFWGRGGEGKSHFIEHLASLGLSKNVFIAVVSLGEALTSVFHRCFPTMALGIEASSPEDFISNIAAQIPDGSIVLLDNIPTTTSDPQFLDGLSFFIGRLSHFNRPIVVVCTGRGIPEGQLRLFDSQRMTDYSDDEVHQLISCLPGKANLKREMESQVQLVLEKTGGNPKLLSFLASNDRAWRIAVNGEKSLTDDENVKAFFVDYWEQVKLDSSPYASAIMMLAVANRVTPIVEEAVFEGTFGSVGWSEFRLRLKSEDLLDIHTNGQIRMHDILADSLYECIIPKRIKEELHYTLFRIYEHRGQEWANEAFRHAVNAGENAVDACLRVLNQHRQYILRRVNLRQAARNLRFLYVLIPDEHSSKSVIGLDLSHCLAMSGYYKEANEILDAIAASSVAIAPHDIEPAFECSRSFVLHCLGRFSEARNRLSTVHTLDEDITREVTFLDGHCAAHLGDFSVAERKLRSLLGFSGTSPDYSEINAMWGLAWVLRAKGEYEESLGLTVKCLGFSLPVRHHRASALALWNRATVFRLTGRLKESRAAYMEAKEYLELYGIRTALHIRHEEAELLRAEGFSDKALKAYEDAMSVALKEIEDVDFRMHAKLGRAEANRQEKRFDEGEYLECIEYFERQNVLWAALAAKVGRFIGRLGNDEATWNEASWLELMSESQKLGMASEIECLSKLRENRSSTQLHPLFFM